MAKKHLASALKQPSGNSKPGPAPIRAVPAPTKRKGGHGTKKAPAPAHPSTGGSQYTPQVQAESDLRFGPQQSALAALLSQAVADRTQGIAVQKSTARGLIAQSSRAQPQVAQIQQQGLEQIQQPYQRLQQDFSTLASNADPIKAAAMRDAAQAQAQQVAAANRASVELKERQVDALAGRQAGISAVQSQAAQQISQIGQQASSLAGQQGAFAQSRVAQLVSDAEKQENANRQAQLGRDVTQRGQDITQRGQDISHQDRAAAAAARKKAQGPRLPGGAKLRTDSDHGKVADQIGQLTSQISQHAADYATDDKGRRLNPKRARHELALDFSSGVPASEIKVDEKGKPLTQPIKDPGIPKAPSNLALSVALDLYFDGHVSRRNLELLHKRGFSINKLGFPTGGPKQRVSAGTGPAVAGAVGGLFGAGARR